MTASTSSTIASDVDWATVQFEPGARVVGSEGRRSAAARRCVGYPRRGERCMTAIQILRLARAMHGCRSWLVGVAARLADDL
jgi:hypothetical protein